MKFLHIFFITYFCATATVYAVSTGESAYEVFELSNVGVGTAVSDTGTFIIKSPGNVGIGSSWPGEALDVFGDIRASNSGNIYGDGSMMTGATSVGWTQDGTYLYVTTASYNFGVGTTTPQGGFVITTGNVGIGTFSSGAPSGYFHVRADTGDLFKVEDADNVGIGTSMTSSTARLAVIGGNVGIGTILASNAALTVMSGNVGVGTWKPDGHFQVNNTSSGPFIVDVSGNVGIGIGTTGNVQSAFLVSNGVGIGTVSVGIGTVTAAGAGLVVKGGNLGIGSSFPGRTVDVQGGVRLRGQLVGLGTLSIGTVVVTAGNTACNTTCTGACLMGQNTGDANETITDCADAGADRCVCFQ